MLEKTDDPMVWGKTAGRPRNFGQAAENIPGHDTDDAQAEQLDLQAEAAGHSDDDDATPSTLVLTKHCPKAMWDEIYAWLQSFGLCRNCCLGALRTWRLSSLQCSWCCHSSQSLEGRASKWQEKVVPRKFSPRDATVSTWRLGYKGAGRPHCWTTRTQSDDGPRDVSVPLFPNSNCPSSWRCGEDGELPPPSQHDSGQWFGASEAPSAICARNWTEIDKALPKSCTSRWRARGSFELAGGREHVMLFFENLGAQSRCWITCHILNL